MSLSSATDSMYKDSSAGFSFPGLKKSECVQDAYDVAAYMQHRIQRNIHTYAPPCKLALRGHLSSIDESKSRPVWVYPFEVSILESKWAIPFYEHLEKNVPAVHFGANSMQRLADMMMGGINGHDESVEVTTDWSSFDSTIPCWLINIAFDIIWESFDNQYALHEDTAIFGGDIMEYKNKFLFNWLKEYFIKTKITLPDGQCIQKEHGIPSGSFFTQAVGSIINYLVINFLNEVYGWNAKRIKVLGDDSSFLVPIYYPGKVSGEKIRALGKQCFGLILKEEKLRIATKQSDRKFLGYSVSGNRYVRDDKDWLLMVLYPERDVHDLSISASRVIAYYLLGGINSEVYCSFFWDYFKRYPYIIGQPLKPTRGMKRLFKYVLRQSYEVLKVPDITKFDFVTIPYLLSSGDDIYGRSI
jgi:hypothetical protein